MRVIEWTSLAEGADDVGRDLPVRDIRPHQP